MCRPHLRHLSLYFMAHELQRYACAFAIDLPHLAHWSPLEPNPQELQR